MTLEALSQEYYGNPRTYLKAFERGVPETVYEAKDQTAYVRLKTRTIIKMETAIARGLIKPDKDGNLPDTVRTEQRAIMRAVTFDEVRGELLAVIETKKFSAMEPKRMILTAAVKFCEKELRNMPFLVVSETDKRDFDDLVALVPEDRQEEIKKQVVPNGNPQAFCMSGVQFVTEVVFCLNQPEAAADQLDQYENPPPASVVEPAGAPA